jgi:uncharacterized membrane protein (UPF0127 family)
MNFRILFALSLALFCATSHAEMPRLELSIGMYRIDAEVAAEDTNRQVGLMNRRAMAAHQGMLFVFPAQRTHCMWMKNTFLPLSVAFLDEQGRIINIADMTPHSETSHCAARPARYALEMNQGWFAAKGIQAGSRIGGVEKAPAPR